MRLTENQIDGGGDTAPATPRKPLAPTPLAAMESGAIGAASMASQMASTPAKPKNSEYRGNAGGSAAKAKTPVDKSGYDRSIKVPQATVDAVKKDGAKASANKVAYGSPGYVGSTMSPNAPVSKEYKEATKRVYPNAKATSPAASSGATNPKQSGPDAARAAATAPKAAAPKAAAPKVYGGAAAEKYKAEEKNAKNKSALPSIFPGAQNMPFKPGTGGKAENMPFKPGTGGKIEKMPFKPLLPPVTPKASAPAKVKVSQATVDAVKAQGKSKAIANAKGNVSNAEYKEAVRRIYQSPAKAKPTSKSKSGGGRTSSAVK
jgi:carnitine O-acetyltransferase